MSGSTESISAIEAFVEAQVRLTPTGVTSDELMFDPSSSRGHQGNNDVFVLTKADDNFQLFRSHADLTFIYGENDIASFWGGGNQTIYDYGVGTTLRFSELDGSQVKVYGLQNDPTAKVELYNPLPTDTVLQSDGHGGTMLGYIDFIGANVTAAQISFVRTATNPSQGGFVT